MLRSGCILMPSGPDDGLRASVMSRHTLSDGVTPDARLVAGLSYQSHWPVLAPPPRLVGSYYRGEIDWETFEQRFRRHLRQPACLRAVAALATLARWRDITILCIEETPERCHRRLVMEECRRLAPSLAVTIG